ncbi:recombinase family protein [Veillonella caviae]|uniref:recombinase family protein n=1 Tax=Veillonella caviae TaxID=248316 RepID=UPI0038B24CCD
MELSRGVIYARYSSDKQREESIEGQIRECKAYAEREGIVITHIYTDRALSARTDKRPEFRQMVEDSKKGKFDYVIVYQLDRFSRSREDSAVYKSILRKNGVKVISAKENISDAPAGIILESMLEGMAEYYSAELSQKVNRGMYENALKGKMNGTPTPLGYRINSDKFLEIDEHEAKAVQLVFDLYLKNYSIPSICSVLDSKGYKSRKGKKLSYSTIRTILGNEKYIGTYRWKDIVIENHIPAIIDKKVFEEVQRMKPLRTKNKGHRSDFYNLCGKLYCGKCGGSYIGSTATSKTGDKHHYYSCCNRRKRKGCDGRNFRRDQLENMIIKRTLEILNTPGTIQAITELAIKTHADIVGDTAYQLESVNNRIKELKGELDNYMMAIAKGYMSDALQAQIEKAESELNSLIAQKANLEIQTPSIGLTTEHIEFFLLKMAKENPSTNAGRARLLDTFIKSCTLYDDRVEIVFNYKSELPQLFDDIEESSLTCDLVDHQGIEPWTP